MTVFDPAQPESWRTLAARHPGLTPLAETTPERFSRKRHGDYGRWRQALLDLPDLIPGASSWGDRVTVEGEATAADQRALERALRQLMPWRKGPFELFGVAIDSEWRSDWKWQRLHGAIHLEGLDVLDVGCGNGYFGWRMLEAGAASVVGVDPTLLFAMQHLAIARWFPDTPNWVLPFGIEELPESRFDCVFSMGVIYHRRDPREHIERLYRHTRPGGQIVVESLVADPGFAPAKRYARMRNVWYVPAIEDLERWLADHGCVDVRCIDATPTTTREQRSTDWMTFESLAAALDPANHKRTVEGYPAPLRAIVTGRRPVCAVT